MIKLYITDISLHPFFYDLMRNKTCPPAPVFGSIFDESACRHFMTDYYGRQKPTPATTRGAGLYDIVHQCNGVVMLNDKNIGIIYFNKAVTVQIK